MIFSRKIFGIVAMIFVSAVLVQCKDKGGEPSLLSKRTKDYFNFTENTKWTYRSELDSSTKFETYTLKNKYRGIEGEINAEFIKYDLVRDKDFSISVRCEVGPTEFADRIAFIVNEKGTLTVSAMIWSQSHKFYGEERDELKFIDKDTINNLPYEGVWHLKTQRVGKFKELKFAEGKGLIYVKFNDDKVLKLKDFSK